MREVVERLAEFLDAWELFRDPLLAGAMGGSVLGMLGVYIVLRKMIFVSAAMSQSAGLGVTVAFLAVARLGVPEALASPTAIAVLFCLVAAFLLSGDPSGAANRRDATLGTIYLIASAGALAIGTRIVQELHDIEALLFGSAVVVSPSDFRASVVVTAALFALHLWWSRGFIAASFDPLGARVRGVPVRLVDAVLLTSIAVAIAFFTRVLGALPVFAYGLLPAIAALRVARNVRWALVVAAFVGALSGVIGYVAAYLWDLPVGASQTLTAAFFVGVVLGAGQLLRRVAT